MSNLSPRQRLVAPLSVALNGPHVGPAQARNLLVDARAALAKGPRALIVDLRAAASIDSLGVAAIAMVVKEAGDCRVIVAAPQPNVLRVLQVTRLTDFVEVFLDMAAAERAFAA